jgi:hypothetical protein
VEIYRVQKRAVQIEDSGFWQLMNLRGQAGELSYALSSRLVWTAPWPPSRRC